MNDMCISGYPYLQGGNASPEDYSVATTFEAVELIVFNKVPRTQYSLIEEWMEEVIEHETLHIVLYKLGLRDAGHNLDHYFPDLSALWEFRRNPVRFIRERTTKGAEATPP